MLVSMAEQGTVADAVHSFEIMTHTALDSERL